jgi:hypothetical protein
MNPFKALNKISVLLIFPAFLYRERGVKGDDEDEISCVKQSHQNSKLQTLNFNPYSSPP